MRYRSNSLLAGAVLAAGITGAAGQCPDGSPPQVIDQMSYCTAVHAVRYENFTGAGTYNKITNMDPNTGACESTPVTFSGPLTPLDEEVCADRDLDVDKKDER